jgi:hypothetical protein
MRPSDMYSQPNAADPVLDERMVLDIVRRHGVSCSALTSIHETGGGPVSMFLTTWSHTCLDTAGMTPSNTW